MGLGMQSCLRGLGLLLRKRGVVGAGEDGQRPRNLVGYRAVFRTPGIPWALRRVKTVASLARWKGIYWLSDVEPMGPLKRKVSDGGGGVEPRDWKKTQYSCREEPDKVAVWAWVLQLREQTMGNDPLPVVISES